MRGELERVLREGYPGAVIQRKGHRTLAKRRGRLVGEIGMWERSRWAFYHYGYSGPTGKPALIKSSAAAFRNALRKAHWTGVIKGGNPALEGEAEPSGFRDFSLPTKRDLTDLRNYVLKYLNERYPGAKVDEIALYAGASWWIASCGKEGLGIRDLDINVFFAPGGPRSLRFIIPLPYVWNGTKRTVDLYWNVLKPGQSVRDYIEGKIKSAKSGRWLTIPDRPWISLLTFDVIWEGVT